MFPETAVVALVARVHVSLIERIARIIAITRKLVEAGFEYVTEVEGCKLFRKRK